ncbi:MAG TPA: hypothetical protein VNQ79_29250 [Blastocatellia bacterium]|nr:hypothetical protein [Blastocatellia bacterium]
MGNPYYYIGQGPVYLAERDANGFPQKLEDMGEVPQVEINVKVDYVDNFESRSGRRRQDLHVPVKTTVEAMMTVKEATLKNLARFMGGTVVSNGGGNVADLAFPTGIVAGDELLLPDLAANVSALVIKDSAGAPLTLTSGTHYTADLKFGRVKFLQTPGTQPYKASYTVPARQYVSFASDLGKEYFVHHEGINTARGDERNRVQLYRVVPEPATKIALKGDDVATYEIKLVPLDDPTKPEGGDLGKFGNWEIIS